MGGGNVTFEPSACAAFAIDGLVPRCVAYPRSGVQAAAALQYAAENGLAVIPCGNATKLSTGNVPRRYDVALCLKEMTQVLRYEPDDLTVSVEPGLSLGDFQEFLNRSGRWIPLDPPGGAAASLGGIAATNASGPLRLRYGAPRDIILGMKIATVEGKVIKTGGRVVKNVAGYDLSKLMIGSFGTLGVILEINFKLYPLPLRRVTRFFRARNLDDAREFRRKALDSPLAPLRMALLDPGGSAIARGSRPEPQQAEYFEIWIEFGGSEAVIRRCLEATEMIAAAAGLAECRCEDAMADEVWNRLADFGAAARNHSEMVSLKVSVPIANTEAFIEFSRREAREADVEHSCCGQLGVGAIYLCLRSEGRTPDLSALILRLRQQATQHAGALVVLHCPTRIKKEIDVWGPAADDFRLMRRLKEVWDPKGTLSPGRFVGCL